MNDGIYLWYGSVICERPVAGFLCYPLPFKSEAFGNRFIIEQFEIKQIAAKNQILQVRGAGSTVVLPGIRFFQVSDV